MGRDGRKFKHHMIPLLPWLPVSESAAGACLTARARKGAGRSLAPQEEKTNCKPAAATNGNREKPAARIAKDEE